MQGQLLHARWVTYYGSMEGQVTLGLTRRLKPKPNNLDLTHMDRVEAWMVLKATSTSLSFTPVAGGIMSVSGMQYFPSVKDERHHQWLNAT